MRTRSIAYDFTPLRWLLIITFAAAAALMLISCDGGDLGILPGSGGDDGTTENVAGEVSFSSATYSYSDGAGYVEITVTRSGGSEGAIDVAYSTVDDSAIAGDDYEAASGTLHWDNGESGDKSFAVAVMYTTPEDDELAFGVELADPAGGAELGSIPLASVTIGPPAQDLCCLASAARLESFGKLYEGYARNPGLGPDIADEAEFLTGVTGSGELCCEAQAARQRTVGTFVGPDALARNPEAEESMTTAFLRMSGAAPSSLCCYAKGARMDAVGDLIDGYDLQPDARAKLELAFRTLSAPLVIDDMCTEQASRWMALVGRVFTPIADAAVNGEDAKIVAIEEIFYLHAGEGPSNAVRGRCKVQVGRMEALGMLIQAIELYPTEAESLLEIAQELLGDAPAEPCARAVAAGYRALENLYWAMATMPSVDFSNAIELIGAPFSMPECEAEEN